MEVDNIERCYCDPRVAGHPNRKFGQNRLNYDRQGPEGPEINYCEEVNNTVFFYEAAAECLPKIEYQFEIEYLKGRENKVADFLSRI